MEYYRYGLSHPLLKTMGVSDNRAEITAAMINLAFGKSGADENAP
jgi:hypothetical protein